MKQLKKLYDSFNTLKDYEDSKVLTSQCDKHLLECNQKEKLILTRNKRTRFIGVVLSLGIAGITLILYILRHHVFLPDNTLRAFTWDDRTYEVPRYISNFINPDGTDFMGFIWSLCLPMVPLTVGVIIASIIFSICNNEMKAIQKVYTTTICGMLLYYIFVLKCFPAILNMLKITSMGSILGFVVLYIPLIIVIIVSSLVLLICGMKSGNSFLAAFIVSIVYSGILFVQMLIHESFVTGKLILYMISCIVATIVAILISLLITTITYGVENGDKNGNAKEKLRTIVMGLAMLTQIAAIIAYIKVASMIRVEIAVVIIYTIILSILFVRILYRSKGKGVKSIILIFLLSGWAYISLTELINDIANNIFIADNSADTLSTARIYCISHTLGNIVASIMVFAFPKNR